MLDGYVIEVVRWLRLAFGKLKLIGILLARSG